MWTVRYLPEAEAEYDELDEREAFAVDNAKDKLQALGPTSDGRTAVTCGEPTGCANYGHARGGVSLVRYTGRSGRSWSSPPSAPKPMLTGVDSAKHVATPKTD